MKIVMTNNEASEFKKTLMPEARNFARELGEDGIDPHYDCLSTRELSYGSVTDDGETTAIEIDDDAMVLYIQTVAKVLKIVTPVATAVRGLIGMLKSLWVNIDTQSADLDSLIKSKVEYRLGTFTVGKASGLAIVEFKKSTGTPLGVVRSCYSYKGSRRKSIDPSIIMDVIEYIDILETREAAEERFDELERVKGWDQL